MGKRLAECQTLGEISEFTRLYERAMTEGRVSDMHVRCPFCKRKFDINMIDGLIVVPDGEGDPISKPSRLVYCPNHTFCGREFKLDPPRNCHFEEWPS